MRLLARPSGRTLPVLLLGGAVVTSLMGETAAGPMRRLAHYVLAPFGDPAMYLTTQFKNFVGNGPERMSEEEARRLRRTNESLHGAIVTLQNEVMRLERQAEVIQQARFGPLRDFPCELIPARVVAGESLPYGRTRLVNAGTSHGAEDGLRVTTRRLLTDRSKATPTRLAAIAGNALIGRLIETGAFAARLQLITDRGFEIRAKIVRVIDPKAPREVTIISRGSASVQTLTPQNNAPIDVIVRGDGSAGLVIPTVAAEHNIRPGDWVFTRDDEAFLPAMIRIGQVSEVAADPEHAGFVTARARPFDDLEAVREVYVVVPRSSKLGPEAPARSSR